MSELKTCILCKETKLSSTEFFYKKGNSLHSKCKPCMKKFNHRDNDFISKKYYNNNKEILQMKRMKRYVLEKTGICLV